jgi:uncharacterized protein (UPF0332 family)
MDEMTKEIVRHRLHRAEEALTEATYLLTGNFVLSAASSAYYACCYAVSALLLTENYTSKTHKGSRILFTKHFITTERISTAAGKFYSNIFDYRQESDYDDFPEISPETASQLIAEARTFVAEISALTLKALA